MDALNSNLDCNQTISQFGVEESVLVLGECEILTHSHNNHSLQMLTESSQHSG